MAILDILEHSPPFLIVLVTLMGLLVGSFLNVVIFRLPVMMQRQWRQDCLEYLGQPQDSDLQEPFNLVLPLSRCPKCQSAIKPYQNIPVISYLVLRGKCAVCKTSISPRYPLIEAFTGLCSMVVAWKLGFGAALPWALLLTWSLITLSF